MKKDVDKIALQGKVVESRVPHGEERWLARLQERLANTIRTAKVSVTLTKNRRTMVSVRREHGQYRVRLHNMFLSADEVVVEALLQFVASNRKESIRVLRDFVEQTESALSSHQATEHRVVTENSVGRVHSLKEIYRQLNERYFHGTIDATVVWGRRQAFRKGQRSIRMGSYSIEDRTIRIHPSLDRTFVPGFFVAFVMYHEMLHQRHDIPVVKGRRQFHTKAFLVEERLFEEYERAKQWERQHLHRLLRNGG